MSDPRVVRVAVAQPEAAPFDSGLAIARVAEWTARAAGEGARLVLFPEAYVGGYPWGLRFGTVVGSRSTDGRRLWARYAESAVTVPGPLTDRLADVARNARVHLAVGVVEREKNAATLYCTILYFGPDGSLLGTHRKLKPTAAERLIWGEGDGSTLTVLDTPFGRVGGLICWENYMPLARAALYAKRVEFYLAPTADARDGWQATLRHIALEGRCFVLGCNQYATRAHYPQDLAAEETATLPDVLSRGGSAIYGPLGECLAGPLFDQAGLLVADLDAQDLMRARFDFDADGHYARPDVFRLIVDERPRRSVEFSATDPDAES